MSSPTEPGIAGAAVPTDRRMHQRPSLRQVIRNSETDSSLFASAPDHYAPMCAP
jgi:hypothetical protein